MDGVFIPHWFFIHELNFQSASLTGAFITPAGETPEEYSQKVNRFRHKKTTIHKSNGIPPLTVNFQSANLQSSNVKTPFGNTTGYSFRDANLRGANINLKLDYSIAAFQGAQFDLFTTIGNLNSSRYRHLVPGKDLAGQTSTHHRFIHGDLYVPETLDSSHRNAYEKCIDRKPWKPEEQKQIENLLERFSSDFPWFMGALNGVTINFKRIGAFCRLVQEPEKATDTTTLAYTSELYFSHDTHPFTANIDIYFTDAVFDAGYAIESIPRIALSLFHELSHARDRLALPVENDFREFVLRNEFCEKASQMASLIKENFLKYAQLKREKKYPEAIQLSRSFAKQYGFPSIYSMLCLPEELKADIQAFVALDPSVESYMNSSLILRARENLGLIVD